ncbi:TetR/AcrR family transcriptional regulator [Nocardia brasiliensis]|uniref:TetR family transcriptional regulator n=1 Tax=Nocardia brasiliensis (strain ATCC 700358 / HUJEG-1) TaxID=1133849 RepID=K0EJ57_NOCB7|nr:TetR/AcrR family transcriptional regulator [Nocardia brasiliensis]AFT99407.1 TetR family transcriptional regulator [Nocardia brasiliensis ATCC 700358]OCF90373.1 TetR family transcriptional regulator [Nocardia brasiliensis]
MAQSTPSDGRRARGDRARTVVLDAVVALASVEGLDGLSMGHVAAAAGVSKSGLFSLWRDKEELQLAAIERARRQWAELVVQPALRAPAGVRQLWALHEARLQFYTDKKLPGGCFFVAIQAEFDDRPGSVHDRLAELAREWDMFVQSIIRDAVESGELRPETDPGVLAFELDALGSGAVPRSRLLDFESAFAQSRAAVLSRLRAWCTDPALLPES